MISYKNPFSIACSRSLPPAKKEKTDYTILKVIQALNLLEQFHGDVDELGLTELSKRLSMKESGVRMLLATLKSRNYIEQEGSTGNYRLGFKNLELAQAALRQIDIYRASLPVLSSISGECGEIAAVAVLRKSRVIELGAIQSEHPVQVVSRVGVNLPVHCTAAGKMLLASQTADEQESLLGQGLERFTRNTVTCPAELRLELGRILEQGYAVDDGELDGEVSGVAAAIRDHAGAVVGAVVITGPSCRIDLERLAGEMACLVRKGAGEISARLGFHGAEQKPSRHASSLEGKPVTPRKTRTRSSTRKQEVALPAWQPWERVGAELPYQGPAGEGEYMGVG